MDKAKTRQWSKDLVSVKAIIDPDGKHRIEISGVINCPMYWPGDAYDAETGDEVQIPRHGDLVAGDLLREAYRWIAANAPAKHRKARQ